MKRISGSIAPFAAAAIGLVGMSEVSQLAKPTADAPAASELRRLGRAWRQLRPTRDRAATASENAAMPAESPRIARRPSTRRTPSSVRPPMRPIAEMSDADATPVMSSETTSGITVIRMALTQSVPIGATRVGGAPAARAVRGRDRPVPTTRPATSATRTRVPSFIGRTAYIIRSPPLMSSDAPVM